VQCAPDDPLEAWPDDRVWQELHMRLATDDDWTLQEGPILEKGITAMRSLVVEPMRYGRLFLAGDAAHVVPPTGAKGMNLAVADVRVLAEALIAWYDSGRIDLLDAYSATCLRRVWRVQHFSWWMTAMLHRFEDDDDGFQHRLQLSQLRYVCSSTAAATSLAENYVGLERV
jgi:p-hydroxybenzoate 3-monooxygenase